MAGPDPVSYIGSFGSRRCNTRDPRCVDVGSGLALTGNSAGKIGDSQARLPGSKSLPIGMGVPIWSQPPVPMDGVHDSTLVASFDGSGRRASAQGRLARRAAVRWRESEGRPLSRLHSRRWILMTELLLAGAMGVGLVAPAFAQSAATHQPGTARYAAPSVQAQTATPFAPQSRPTAVARPCGADLASRQAHQASTSDPHTRTASSTFNHGSAGASHHRAGPSPDRWPGVA